MNVKTVLSVFILAAFCCTTSLLAQPGAGDKAQLYLFWEIVVYPDKVAQFEEASKKQNALYEKNDFAYPWSTASTNDNTYYYGIPIDNYAMMDTIFKAFGEMEVKLGEDAKALQEDFDGTMKSIRAQVWSLNYDLSHNPENPRIAPEEEGFTDWLFYYFKPGTESKVYEYSKKWNAFIKTKNLNHPYQVWIGGLGTEEPVYCFVDAGKDPVDYHTQWAELDKTIGKELKDFWAEMAKYTVRTEHKTGRSRPDLSMVPFSQRRPTTE